VEAGDDLLLFARGNRVRLARTPLTRRLAAALPYRPFSVEQLYRELDGEVSKDALTALVRQLARLGGLRPAGAA
jgi:hypothetical protein